VLKANNNKNKGNIVISDLDNSLSLSDSSELGDLYKSKNYQKKLIKKSVKDLELSDKYTKITNDLIDFSGLDNDDIDEDGLADFYKSKEYQKVLISKDLGMNYKKVLKANNKKNKGNMVISDLDNSLSLSDSSELGDLYKSKNYQKKLIKESVKDLELSDKYTKITNDLIDFSGLDNDDIDEDELADFYKSKEYRKVLILKDLGMNYKKVNYEKVLKANNKKNKGNIVISDLDNSLSLSDNSELDDLYKSKDYQKKLIKESVKDLEISSKLGCTNDELLFSEKLNMIGANLEEERLFKRHLKSSIDIDNFEEESVFKSHPDFFVNTANFIKYMERGVTVFEQNDFFNFIKKLKNEYRRRGSGVFNYKYEKKIYTSNGSIYKYEKKYVWRINTRYISAVHLEKL
jgi:cytochrome b involved in lipid metabolism